MNSDIRIIDNFLPQNEYDSIKNILLNNGIFSWYFYDNKTPEDQQITFDEKYDHQFVHILYHNYEVKSAYFEKIAKPFIEKINPIALVRIKVNLTTATPEIIKYGWHKDYDNFEGQTAIYYVNDNNGKTIFKNNIEVESISNRIIIFPNHMEHTATSCTNTKKRVVINFNFIK